MADTGAPHFIPYVEPTDLVREYPAADEAQAFAVAAGLTAAGNAGIGSNVVTSQTTTAVTSTSTDYADAGLSATITPSSDTSKILVIASVYIGARKSDTDIPSVGLRIVRTATDVFTSNRNLHLGMAGGGNPSRLATRATIFHLDEPSTTSATTYKIQFNITATGASGTGYFSRDDFDATGMPSDIVLIEVAP